MQLDKSKEDNDVEGLDENSSGGWGSDYPLDSVFVRNEVRSVAEVVKRIDAGRYKLDPDFQRDFVWRVDKQSRLIESCVMRIPLPVFYVAEARDGKIAVVDGLQRLTTFYRFLNDHFSLSLKSDEGEAAHPLDGKKFSGLPLQLQERIEDTQLTLYILDPNAPERAKLDIFERVNSGEPLTRQQMRNSLFNGPSTVWLKNAANSPEFRAATGESLDKKSMRDREAINRFCAFFIFGEERYKKADMDAFLAQSLVEMNEGRVNLETLSSYFKFSMEANRWLFGSHCFRKSIAVMDDPLEPRKVINIALFDVLSVILAQENRDKLVDNKVRYQGAVIELLSDDSFVHSITYSTNSTKQVKKRFDMVRQCFREI